MHFTFKSCLLRIFWSKFGIYEMMGENGNFLLISYIITKIFWKPVLLCFTLNPRNCYCTTTTHPTQPANQSYNSLSTELSSVEMDIIQGH